MSAELADQRTNSAAEIGKLKTDLEETSGANLELESKLINMSELCSQQDLVRQNYEAEISRCQCYETFFSFVTDNKA